MAQIILDSSNNLIQGDFDNATVNNRTKFKTTTLNGTTNVYAVPNGSSTSAGYSVSNAADPTNASKITIATNGSTDTQIISGINGTGTYLPMSFYTNNALAAQIDTSGNFFGTAKMGGVGSVIQVVNATYSTQGSTSSGAFVDTSLTATITPSSASNKILVFVSQTGLYKAGSNSYIILRLVRGATSIVEIEKEIVTTASTGTSTAATSTTYLDSPATTSATTYKTQIALGGAAGTIYWNVTSCTSTITLMEIKA